MLFPRLPFGFVEGLGVILSEKPSLEVARRRRLFLEGLHELESRDAIFARGDDFAIEDGRAQFQPRNSVGDGWEFCFQRQAVSWPEVRLAARTEDRDWSIPFSFISKIQSGEANGSLTLFAMIGGAKAGKLFLGIPRNKVPDERLILELDAG